MRCWRVTLLMFSVLAFVSGTVFSLQAQERSKVFKLEREGLKLETQALGSDAVQAFFIGREFSAADALMIARQGCVFRSAIGNGGAQAGAPDITIDLRQWRLAHKGGQSAPRVREDWQKIWQKRQVPEDAKTAFYWALFPTMQSYGPTDYNWGMLTFGLAPGTRFDLQLRWQYKGQGREFTLKGLQCAR